MLLGKIKLVGGNKTAGDHFLVLFFFYFSVTIAWGCNHITGTGGGGGVGIPSTGLLMIALVFPHAL